MDEMDCRAQEDLLAKRDHKVKLVKWVLKVRQVQLDQWVIEVLL
jgi:hypothetical protein